MKKTKILLLLVLILPSCNRVKKQDENAKNPETINVQVDPAINIQLSQVATKIRYVALETTNNNVFGSVFKMNILDKRIFILDGQQKNFLVFDSSGHFLFQESSIGHGPGEFVVINDFYIDTTRDRIEILDPGNTKIIRYDYTGKLINERKFTNYCTYFTKFGENNYTFFLDNQVYKMKGYDKDYNIIQTDSLMQIKNVLMPIKDEFKDIIFGLVNCFVNYENGVNVVLPLENSIYYLTKDKIITKYKIDFGKFTTTESMYAPLKKYTSDSSSSPQVKMMKLIQEETKIQNKIQQSGYVTALYNVLENKNFLFIRFSKDRDQYTTIYDKNTGHMYTGKSVKNDIDLGLFGQPMVLLDNDELVSVIYPIDLKNRIKSLIELYSMESVKLKDNKNFLNLKSLSDSLNDSDNPVLAYISLKEF